MILKSVRPRNYGPFVGDSVLQVEPDVTVLTGPNDAGKSMVLRAIDLLCSEGSISQREVNRERSREYRGVWNQDSEITCEAEFVVTERSANKFANLRRVPAEAVLSVRRPLGDPNKGVDVLEVKKVDSSEKPNARVAELPSILRLPLECEVGEAIQLGTPNPAERHLLLLGFGPAFNLKQHADVDETERSFRVRDAEDRLNARLSEIMPVSMPFKFRLQEIAGDPSRLGIGLLDGHNGFTLIGSRGSGVKRLLSVMGALLRIDPSQGHTIVLYDEPEMSLHADAQHMLRRLLENVAANPTVQVIYSTHSSAMINTLRPHSVRVLSRSRVGDRAVTTFNNGTPAKNFLLVRTSLGLSPADSLLYAPITIIAEGVTEVRCLPFIIQKLTDAGMLDREAVDALLAQTHIVDGEGSGIEQMCRLARSQNAHPIVFHDGDNEHEVKEIRKKHDDVPVIVLQKGTEFEDLVPKPTYVAAAVELAKERGITATGDEFDQWEVERAPHEKEFTSKRVERWLKETHGIKLSKPLVMQKAIEISEPAAINPQNIVELFGAMQQVSTRL